MTRLVLRDLRAVLVVGLLATVAQADVALAQGRPAPTCRTNEVIREMLALEKELEAARERMSRAWETVSEDSHRLQVCYEAYHDDNKCLAARKVYDQDKAAAERANSHYGDVSQRLDELKRLPDCPFEPPPPPPPPPKPPTPDPRPPAAGVPRNVTITHRGSCPPCAAIAAKFNKAAEDYAAAVSKGTLDEPLMKAEMEEYGRELDACEQKQCTPPTTVPIFRGPSSPPAPPRGGNLDAPPAQTPGVNRPTSPTSPSRTLGPSAVPPPRDPGLSAPPSAPPGAINRPGETQAPGAGSAFTYRHTACSSCQDNAAAHNRAVDEHAQALRSNSSAEPLLKGKVGTLARVLDACEQRCASRATPGPIMPHVSPGPSSQPNAGPSGLR